ncbi:carboxypeptidase regulatory-like domain-containing protein [Larkinella terrae]|uniref:Carboxypeptidase regulatory-like domain-containing protein n=1 Tax=Larkinella terrae TaxID=2025311 RepID=A0A7K0ESN7_9BACT|nr:carboxypeptidase regulatory-like domain-containing protein [Larkinella terrae]MRS64556.1 hypothetical protein [Larkinella terrae]
MMANRFFLHLALVGALLSGCGKTADDVLGPKQGYVSGTVVDTKGQPIAGALVFIDETGPYMSGASTHTDAKGHFRIKLENRVYRVYATFERKYGGRTYEIRLKPSNSDSFTAVDSPVIDFQWVLSGKKPEPLVGYFGGYVGLYQGDTNIPKNEVEFTFTPTDLIDGSVGNPLKIKANLVSTQYLEDIPLGKYNIRAVHKPAAGGAVRTILLRNRTTRQTSENTGFVNLEFEPESAGFYRGNIEYYEP